MVFTKYISSAQILWSIGNIVAVNHAINGWSVINAFVHVCCKNNQAPLAPPTPLVISINAVINPVTLSITTVATGIKISPNTTLNCCQASCKFDNFPSIVPDCLSIKFAHLPCSPPSEFMADSISLNEISLSDAMSNILSLATPNFCANISTMGIPLFINWYKSFVIALPWVAVVP